jgi:Bacterial SH3 domain
MPCVYLDRELDGNNNITGSYKISIDINRKLSWVGNPNKLEPCHHIKVLNGQSVKTILLKKFEKYKNENKDRDWLYLPSLELDEVLIIMNEYKEERIDNTYQSSLSPSSDTGIGGCLMTLGILFIIAVVCANPPNNTISQKDEGTTSTKWTAIVDSRLLNKTYTGGVNIRSDHTKNSKLIGTLRNGTPIFISKKSHGWVEIVLDNGRKGWVAGRVNALKVLTT